METPFIYMIPISLGLGFFAMIVLVVWAKAHSRAQQARFNAEVQTKLIERFGSGPELVDFLKSPEGQQFATGIGKLPRLAARDRVVGGFSRAIFLTFLGVAFLLLCLTDMSNPGFLIAGAVLTALGLANLISSIVSLKLSKRMGLVDSDDDAANRTPLINV
jgi:hypothetical protein